MPYDHKSLEAKWQKFWLENKIFQTKNPDTHTQTDTQGNGNIVSGTVEDSTVSSVAVSVPPEAKPKKYILDMFPYPSGTGLHVGHPKGYTATDIVGRYYHAKGYNILHPMGFDAFGLPAENFAIKTGTHPAITTKNNVDTFVTQLKALGFGYDWDRMIDTTDPKYYKWTQWIFLELFKRGLAYEQDLPINYCPSCKTGLANEEVLSDNSCDRCGTSVERRPIRQWVLKITEYADRLIEDLDELDWSESVKEMQRNWIGKSEGCEFRMMKKVDTKKGRLPLSENGGVHNGLAKPSLASIISDDIIKVKKKIKFLGSIEGQVVTEEKKKISFRSNDILSHFRGKSKKDFIQRASLLGTLFSLIDRMTFNDDGIGYFACKSLVVRVILGKQSNGNYFVKTYYVDDKLTEAYKETVQKSLKSIPFISVYTTRIDTVFGMTYAVMAPDHPQVMDFITDSEKLNCLTYIEQAKGKSDQDRTNEGKEKTGVFTGSYVVNPYNGEAVPLWIADYVLGHYGTGAVMAVPAHDERDFEFAKKYNLPIKEVIATYNKLTGDSTPRDGFPTRNKICTTCVIEHPTEKKYLVEKFVNGEVSFLGGGLEEYDASPEAGAIRELKEESGLHDFGEIRKIGILVGHGFKERKQTNCLDPDHIFYIKLNSLSGFREVANEDNIEYRNVWWTKEEISNSSLLKSHHKKMFEMMSDTSILTDDGILMNSGEFDLLTSAEARKVLTEKAETEGFGQKKVNYKLRDWLFSRQRYWGEPIPLIHISHEDYAKLPRIERIEDAKEGIASILSSGGTKDLLESGADSSQARNDKNNGPRESLIIDGTIFSDIYDGITGKIIIDSRLPLVLPEVERYEPAGDGQSPLATLPDWVNVQLADNLSGKRETNTMPQWGGSCWYYLRFMDAKNPNALASKEALDYWQNVDEYVGGTEHAVLHLLYARFWHKVLYDIGVVPTKEPFQKLVNQGMILAYAYERPDGGLVAVDLVEEKDGKFFIIETGEEVKRIVAKMSKSLKNTANPMDIVEEHGADTLRLYEMSIGDFRDSAPWNPEAIIGVRRFLDKVYATFIEGKNEAKDDMKAMKLLHKTIKKVEEDIGEYKFNTAVSAMQILLNEGCPVDPEFRSEWQEKFAIILHPFAPHMAEELWSHMSKNESIYQAEWPEYDEFMLVDDEVTIAVQIGGKLRGTFTFLNGVAQEEVSEIVRADPGIAKWLEGKEIVKEIFIPNKMLSIVVK